MKSSDKTPPQATALASSTKVAELDAWRTIVSALRDLDVAAQARVLKSVATLLEIDLGSGHTGSPQSKVSANGTGTTSSEADELQLGPTEFLQQKRPATDVDIVACLAYYLTHYRQTPHFKTIDISQLKSEAAHNILADAAQSVHNATKAGLLVLAIKDHLQLSAAGDIYVQELPDKVAARAAIDEFRRKRSKRPGSSSKSEDNRK